MKLQKKLFVLVMAMCGIVCLAGCSKKTPMMAEDFVSIMEDLDYSVAGPMSPAAPAETMVSAMKENGSCNVTLMVFENRQDAMEWYNELIAKHEFMIESAKVKSTVTAGNYSKVSLKLDGGEYILYSRIDNTVLRVEVPGEYAAEIKEALKEYGY